MISTNYGTQFWDHQNGIWYYSCNIFPNISKNLGQEFYIYSSRCHPFIHDIYFPRLWGWCRSPQNGKQLESIDHGTHDVTSSTCYRIPSLSNSGVNIAIFVWIHVGYVSVSSFNFTTPLHGATQWIQPIFCKNTPWRNTKESNQDGHLCLEYERIVTNKILLELQL